MDYWGAKGYVDPPPYTHTYTLTSQIIEGSWPPAPPPLPMPMVNITKLLGEDLLSHIVLTKSIAVIYFAEQL